MKREALSIGIELTGCHQLLGGEKSPAVAVEAEVGGFFGLAQWPFWELSLITSKRGGPIVPYGGAKLSSLGAREGVGEIQIEKMERAPQSPAFFRECYYGKVREWSFEFELSPVEKKPNYFLG